MKCLICGKILATNSSRGIANHLRVVHNLSRVEYSDKFNLNGFERCKICGKLFLKKNKTGYCNIHRDRSGKNNSFYNKQHSKETIALLKEKCRVASKKLGENKEYRKNVIDGATGKKRSDKFKETQRRNAYKQFEDKKQRSIRSTKMKESGRNGKITYSPHNSYNRSTLEKDLFLTLKRKYKNEYKVHHKTIRINEKGYYPDIIIENSLIIEFNGDYGHANPNKYSATDIIHHKYTAEQIGKRDKQRVEAFSSADYKTLIIGENEFRANKEKTIDIISEGIEEKIKNE